MADNLVKLMGKLVREKEALRTKERRLARRETQMIDSLRQLLPRMGYRLVTSDGPRRLRRSGAVIGSGKPKRLRCPKCERRFAHPLPLARHLSATHGIRVGKSRVRKSRRKVKRR
jgi:uncharacterized C2H2 Zn-finger protein